LLLGFFANRFLVSTLLLFLTSDSLAFTAERPQVYYEAGDFSVAFMPGAALFGT
jgi:hypothetical protein